MKQKNLIIVFCFPFIITYSQTQTNNILLFKDGNGLYHYDFKTGKDLCLLKIPCSQDFIIEQINFEEIVFGYCSKARNLKLNDEFIRETEYHFYKYSNKVVSKEKIINHKYIQTKHKLIVSRFNINDTIITIQYVDTLQNVFRAMDLSYSDKKGSFTGVDIDFSKDIKFENSFFVETGSIYEVKKNDTVLFLKRSVEGSIVKYYDFICDYSKRKMIANCCVFDKYKLLSEKVVEINKKNKKLTFITNGGLDDMKLSPNKRFVIFTRDNNKSSDCYDNILDIFIIDVRNKEKRYIGEASSVFWIKE